MGRFVHGFQRPCALGFFESVDFSMLEWEGDELKGVKPDFVRNVVRMLGEAKRERLRIYMTLFDAQVYRPDRQKPESRGRSQYLLTEAGYRRFLTLALGPLLRAVQEAGLAAVPVSFSVRLAWILPLPRAFFADQGPMACADFFDFHLTRLRRDFGL